MKRIIRLTETDLKRIVRRVIREADAPYVDPCQDEVDTLSDLVGENRVPKSCLGADMEAQCAKDLMKMATQGPDPRVMMAAKELAKCRKENSGMMF